MIGYIIVVVISCVVLIKIVRDIMNGLNSRNWPITTGTIIQSGIHTRQKTDEDGFTSTTYGATVVYTFNISGKEFKETRRSFSGVRTSSVRQAEQILARYPQGSSVTIYYHPDNPSLCVLEPGVSWLTYAGMIILLGLLVFGILGVLGLIG